MRYIYSLVCFLLLAVANIQADNLTHPVSLVPCPVSIVPGTGNFHFSAKTTFAVENEEQAVEVRWFTELFTRAAGFTPSIKVGNRKGDVCLVTDAGLKNESYKLEITAKKSRFMLPMCKASSMPCKASVSCCQHLSRVSKW